MIVAAAAFTLVGCAALPFFGGGFIPELKEGHFIVHMSAVRGTSLDQSLRIGARVAEAVRKLPEVGVVPRVRSRGKNPGWDDARADGRRRSPA